MLPYCEQCDDVVDFEVQSKTKQKVVKGREIAYLAKEAYCAECHSPIFVPEIHDFNLKQMNEAYTEAEDLVRTSEIENIIEMYKIGKRPLSLVLGWGESTITRYLNGDVPSKQYSQTLRKIMEDPSYMSELLEQNKAKISDIAYNKCKEAIQDILGENDDIRSNQKKIDSVVQYLLYKSEEITPLALQKLLYYSQAFNKAINHEFLFNDDCQAWVHGPVYRTVYEKYKKYGYNPIEENLSEYNYQYLTEEEIGLLDSIVSNFGCYSGKVLEEMTHIETPWKETRKGLDDKVNSNRIISKQSIEKYFNEIKNKYNMVNISDIRDYSKDIFYKSHF